MKKLMNKIDRFCWKHPNFGISNLMLFVVIGTAIAWLFVMMDSTGTLAYYLYFDPQLFCRGQIWRLVTHIIMPTTSRPLMLLIQLYFYYFIGRCLEQEWGKGRFTIYYFMGVLLNVIYSLLVYALFGRVFAADVSYINLSMFLAFATLWPEQQVLLFYIIPIKVKWLGILDAVLFGVSVVSSLLAGDVIGALVPVVAVGNYLLFCGGWLFDYLRPSRARQRAKTVQFKQAVRRTQQTQRQQGYSRKCAVCGRTDTDNPGLEFRYCSRCEGYHCFCIDHINNHIHFTE